MPCDREVHGVQIREFTRHGSRGDKFQLADQVADVPVVAQKVKKKHGKPAGAALELGG